MVVTPESALVRPATPPPVYPLELQLDVDNVVDQGAMRLVGPAVGDEDEEPPEYTAAEKAEREKAKGKEKGKGKGKEIMPAGAVDAGNKAKAGDNTSAEKGDAPSVRSSPGSVDDTVPSLPHTPTEGVFGAAVGAGGGTGAGTGSGAVGGGTSRFMMSLSMLGRSKLPLGVMLGTGGVAAVVKKTGTCFLNCSRWYFYFIFRALLSYRLCLGVSDERAARDVGHGSCRFSVGHAWMYDPVCCHAAIFFSVAILRVCNGADDYYPRRRCLHVEYGGRIALEINSDRAYERFGRRWSARRCVLSLYCLAGLVVHMICHICDVPVFSSSLLMGGYSGGTHFTFT